jgi:superfamily II DNA helicase RecQ
MLADPSEDLRPVWEVNDIRALVQHAFNKRACLFQIKIAQALYAGKDTIACSLTGSGKTLTFFIPLLMKKADGEERTSIIVTPLNLLGKQMEDDMKASEITTVAVSRDTAKTSLFKICILLLKVN